MSIQSELLNSMMEQGFEEFEPDKGTRQILLNALDVFARKGLEGAKIKDIAAKAGFSQGFVYNYFKSKDEIFIKIVDLAAEGAGATVEKAAKLPGSAYERIYWLAEALLSPDSIAMQHWRLIMLQAATLENIPEEAKRVSKEKMKKPFQHLIPLIVEGQKDGDIVAADPFMLAITFFSMIQGLGITRMQGSREMPFPTIDMVLSFLRTNHQTSKE